MPTIWTYVRAGAILAGSSAALLTGGIAHADTAPPPGPVPANIAQQFLSSAANAPQILQSLATALGVAPLSTPKAPEPGLAAVSSLPGFTPAAPAATPSIPGVNTAIPGLTAPAAVAPAPAAVPAIPGVNAPIPGLTAPAPAAPAVSGVVPTAQVGLPSLPYLPVQLPPQVSLPGDIPALASGAVQGVSGPAASAGPSTLLAALP